MNADTLYSAGINYENGVKRFKGNMRVYDRLLLRFLDDESLLRARRSYESGDMARFADDIHEIKGVAGNLDITGLYTMASRMMNILRSADYDADELGELFQRICDDYEHAKEGIRTANAND